MEEVLADIKQRDLQDTTRKITPLKKAEDAREIDTTSLSIEEVTGIVIEEVKKHGYCQTV